MLGDSGLRGFINICGLSSENNHLTCTFGLKLLENLINPSFTRCSSEFFVIFVNLTSKELAELQLEKHMKVLHIKGCKKSALRLLSLYKRYNCNYDETKLMDKQTLESYNRWHSLSS